MDVLITITIFLILSVAVVLWGFLASERRSTTGRDIVRLSGRKRVHCEICGDVYEDVPTAGMTRCPVCGSYNRLDSASDDARD